MAELKIQKKNTKKSWLWALLALIAVVAVIWIITGEGDKEDEAYVENEEQVANESGIWGDDSGSPEQSYTLDAEAQEAVEQYVTFTSDLGEIEIDHETSHKGITLLADALAALSDETQNEVQDLRQQADQLLENTMSDEHASILRNAFLKAANIIEKQVANNDALTEQVSEVTKAAQAVDEEVLVTNQKDAVKNFFNKSASALNSLE